MRDEHLDTCAVCRERLDKLFLFSKLSRDENIELSMRLVSREAPIMQRAVWQEEQKVAFAEFKVDQLEEKYEIYVDINEG